MSKFTKSITRTYSFEEDTVTVVMERMKRKDAFKITPHLGEPDADGRFRLPFSKQVELLDVAGDILKKYVRSITGLDLSEYISEIQEPAKVIDLVFDEAYFMPLVGDMVSDLMEASFSVGKYDEKKSGRPQEDTSQERDLPAKEVGMSSEELPSMSGSEHSDTVMITAEPGSIE